MSVIVKDSSEDIWLYCKGADSAVLPLITEGKIQEVTVHVADFSMVRCPIYNNHRTKARTKAETAENIFTFFSRQFQEALSYTCTKKSQFYFVILLVAILCFIIYCKCQSLIKIS